MAEPTITNIDGIIEQVDIVEQDSKAGKRYSVIRLTLNNGYLLEMFTRERAEVAMLRQELRLVKDGK